MLHSCKRRSLRQVEREITAALHRSLVLRDDRRVCIGVSGGKDSTFLLAMLIRIRDQIRSGLELHAIHVSDSGSPCFHDGAFDAIRDYCLNRSVEVHVVAPDQTQAAENCHRCAWRRREALFRTANDLGLTTVALGHSAYDLAVTALMNMLHHGNLETMPELMRFFDGRIRVIRPLASVTRDEILHHHHRLELPPPPPSCLREVGHVRAHCQELLDRALEKNPRALINVLKAASRWESD